MTENGPFLRLYLILLGHRIMITKFKLVFPSDRGVTDVRYEGLDKDDNKSGTMVKHEGI